MRWPWQKKPRLDRPRLEFHLGRVSSGSRIYLDGEDISHWVTGLWVEAEVGDLTKVTVSLLPSYVRVMLEDRTLETLSVVATGEDGVTREQTRLVPEPGAEALAQHLEDQAQRTKPEWVIHTPSSEEVEGETPVTP